MSPRRLCARRNDITAKSGESNLYTSARLRVMKADPVFLFVPILFASVLVPIAGNTVKTGLAADLIWCSRWGGRSLNSPTAVLSSHMIPRFNDSSLGYCYRFQLNGNYCGPACGQMLFAFLEWNPLPSQTELAQEMRTDYFNTTFIWWFPAPFASRNLTMKLEPNLLATGNESFAAQTLKHWISENYPCVVLIGVDIIAGQTPTKVGHYIVVAGYNESHFYILDPGRPECAVRWMLLTEFVNAWKFSNCTAEVLYARPKLLLRVHTLDCLQSELPFATVVLSNATLSTSMSTVAPSSVEFPKVDMGEYNLTISYLGAKITRSVLLVKDTYLEIAFGFPVVGVLSVGLLLLILLVVLVLIWMRGRKRSQMATIAKSETAQTPSMHSHRYHRTSESLPKS